MPSPASARQVGGTHYKDMAVQPWDAMQSWMSSEAFQGYLRTCAIKILDLFEFYNENDSPIALKLIDERIPLDEK